MQAKLTSMLGFAARCGCQLCCGRHCGWCLALVLRYMHVRLNGTVRLLQGLVSAVLWQALQLLDQPRAALHASHAE